MHVTWLSGSPKLLSTTVNLSFSNRTRPPPLVPTHRMWEWFIDSVSNRQRTCSFGKPELLSYTVHFSSTLRIRPPPSVPNQIEPSEADSIALMSFETVLFGISTTAHLRPL